MFHQFFGDHGKTLLKVFSVGLSVVCTLSFLTQYIHPWYMVAIAFGFFEIAFLVWLFQFKHRSRSILHFLMYGAMTVLCGVTTN